jgi:hypothetical protein
MFSIPNFFEKFLTWQGRVLDADPLILLIRVSDPHRFNADPDTDPDTAFFIIADPDSGSGSRIRIQGLMI